MTTRALFSAARVTTCVACAALAILLAAFWIVDDGSRELDYFSRDGRGVGVYVIGGHMFWAAFETSKPPHDTGLHVRADHSWSVGLYCLVMVAEQGARLPLNGVIGIARVDDRPAHETFRSARIVGFPAGALIAALAIPPTRAIARFMHRRRRARRGACVQCGYDLRETPESCPECGATAPPSPRRDSEAEATPRVV